MGIACYAAMVGAWMRVADQEEMLGKLWKRVAYATRYGRAGLQESLELSQEDLGAFITAVGEIVEEENRAAKGR